jgi:hypothetical protein
VQRGRLDCGAGLRREHPPVGDDYFDGATWTNIVSAVIEGNVPGTYCGSPSGAFLN